MNRLQRRAIILAATMPDLPAQDFQIWITRGGAPPVPGGFLRRGPQGIGMAEVDGRLFTEPLADGVMISLEASGGSASASEPLMSAALPRD